MSAARNAFTTYLVKVVDEGDGRKVCLEIDDDEQIDF